MTESQEKPLRNALWSTGLSDCSVMQVYEWQSIDLSGIFAHVSYNSLLCLKREWYVWWGQNRALLCDPDYW